MPPIPTSRLCKGLSQVLYLLPFPTTVEYSELAQEAAVPSGTGVHRCSTNPCFADLSFLTPSQPLQGRFSISTTVIWSHRRTANLAQSPEEGVQVLPSTGSWHLVPESQTCRGAPFQAVPNGHHGLNVVTLNQAKPRLCGELSRERVLSTSLGSFWSGTQLFSWRGTHF